ncbi:MAG: tRNA (adenosine(37)-N6)-threonylcarbamoyltransferase complex dimerization subunit type 1 TsaB [Spirochaetes bacterium]|nr:tRNA (adenosine(37)-N6)-threonylcarbamoyltransferase complex dimerization subunit type 1 TsaB [Spirochaetota bacterium]
MNTLLIDTATNIEVIAVTTPTSQCDLSTHVNLSHSVTLFERIRSALKRAEISIREINLIGVGIGPGSFTGVRIAVASARMLAQVLKVPLVGIESQLIWALACDVSNDDYILVAFDAKKERVFGALYKKNRLSNTFEIIVPPGDYYLHELLAQQCIKSPLLCIGDGINRFEKTINELAPRAILHKNFIPSGIPACHYAQQLYLHHPERYQHFKNTLPYYARKSDAEIILEQKKKQC